MGHGPDTHTAAGSRHPWPDVDSHRASDTNESEIRERRKERERGRVCLINAHRQAWCFNWRAPTACFSSSGMLHLSTQTLFDEGVVGVSPSLSVTSLAALLRRLPMFRRFQPPGSTVTVAWQQKVNIHQRKWRPFCSQIAVVKTGVLHARRDPRYYPLRRS